MDTADCALSAQFKMSDKLYGNIMISDISAMLQRQREREEVDRENVTRNVVQDQRS